MQQTIRDIGKLAGYLRAAADQFDRDEKLVAVDGVPLSARLATQFRDQAREARAYADLFEEAEYLILVEPGEG